MRYGSVYVLTNRVTNCQYVGQTIQAVRNRWRAHVANAKQPKFDIGKAIDAYGEYAFDIEEVYVAFDKAGLDAAEVLWIEYLNPVYNMTRGGAGSPIKETSEELRKKRAAAAKRRWADPEWRAKTVAKIREATPLDQKKERGKRLAQYNGGAIRWKDHTKKKTLRKSRADSVKTSWADPSIRAKRVAGLQNRAKDPAVKSKMLANLRKPQTKEARDRSAKAKHKPVYCPELQVTFLSRNHAALYFNTGRDAIIRALKLGSRLQYKYHLENAL